MSQRILALDLGTNTGVCLRIDAGSDVWHWTLSGSPGEKGIQLTARLTGAIDRHAPDIIVFEEPLFTARSMSAAALRYGLQMVVQIVCEHRKVPYLGAHVATVKKHATGRGNAKKHEMVAAAQEALGRGCTTDEADAFWVADYTMSAGVTV